MAITAATQQQQRNFDNFTFTPLFFTPVFQASAPLTHIGTVNRLIEHTKKQLVSARHVTFSSLTIFLLVEHWSLWRTIGSHPLLPLAPVKHWCSDCIPRLFGRNYSSVLDASLETLSSKPIIFPPKKKGRKNDNKQPCPLFRLNYFRYLLVRQRKRRY